MLVITAITHDRKGKIIKVQIDGVNREVSEIAELVLSGAEMAQAVINGTVFEVQAVDSPNAGRFLRGTGPSLDDMPAAPLTQVTFGDSVAWGLGIRRANKYTALVARRLAAANRETSMTVLNFANNGARIGAMPRNPSNFTVSLTARGENTIGEVMDARVSTHQQIDAFLASGPQAHPAPEAVDFILLNAGANDVKLKKILTFLKNDASIVRIVRAMVTINMDNLLRRMLDTFPNARIFVTGYYPIVTAKSQPHNVAELLLAIQYATMVTPTHPSPLSVLKGTAKANIVLNCKTFADEYQMALNNIVTRINSEAPLRERLFFARPSFAPRHGLFGPPRTSRLWRLNAVGFVTDETAGSRGPQCDAAFSPGAANLQCRASSIGHPNLAGARAYFRAIRKHL